MMAKLNYLEKRRLNRVSDNIKQTIIRRIERIYDYMNKPEFVWYLNNGMGKQNQYELLTMINKLNLPLASNGIDILPILQYQFYLDSGLYKIRPAEATFDKFNIVFANVYYHLGGKRKLNWEKILEREKNDE